MAPKLQYFVGEALSNLRRNWLMTLAAVITVTVSLFLLGLAIVGGSIVENIVGNWEGKVELNIFLRDDITPDQTRELGSALTSMPEVAQVFYVSKDEAYKEFADMFKDQPSLTENVNADALPASYRVKLVDPDKVEAVRTRIDGRPGVDEVNYGGDAVRRLIQLNSVFRAFAIGGTVLLLAAATLLISNTIRLAIYARRREIGIMKLVGATNWFIRVPFIFEGIAEAAGGALVATGLIYGIKASLLDSAQQQILFLPITFGAEVIVRVLLVLLTVGVCVGALGSALALRRFLEV